MSGIREANRLLSQRGCLTLKEGFKGATDFRTLSDYRATVRNITRHLNVKRKTKKNMGRVEKKRKLEDVHYDNLVGEENMNCAEDGVLEMKVKTERVDDEERNGHMGMNNGIKNEERSTELTIQNEGDIVKESSDSVLCSDTVSKDTKNNGNNKYQKCNDVSGGDGDEERITVNKENEIKDMRGISENKDNSENDGRHNKDILIRTNENIVCDVKSQDIDKSPLHTSTPPFERDQHTCTPPREHEAHTCTTPSENEQHTSMPPLEHEAHTSTPPLEREQHTSTPPLECEQHTSTPPPEREQHTSKTPLKHEAHTSTPPLECEQHTSKTPLVHEAHTSTPPLEQEAHTSTPPLVHEAHTSTPPLQCEQHTSTPPLVHEAHTSTLPLEREQHTSTTPMEHEAHTSTPHALERERLKTDCDM